jgi:hypothetical protein
MISSDWNKMCFEAAGTFEFRMVRPCTFRACRFSEEDGQYRYKQVKRM